MVRSTINSVCHDIATLTRGEIEIRLLVCIVLVVATAICRQPDPGQVELEASPIDDGIITYNKTPL